MGHSRRSDRAPITSGLPRETDILGVLRHVSKVPQQDPCTAERHLHFLTSDGRMSAHAQAVVGQNAASAREMAAAGKAKRLTLSANALYVGRVVTSAAAKLPH
jgi:hypothetical protein